MKRRPEVHFDSDGAHVKNVCPIDAFVQVECFKLMQEQHRDMKETLQQILKFDPDGKEPASVVALDCMRRFKRMQSKMDQLEQAGKLHNCSPDGDECEEKPPRF